MKTQEMYKASEAHVDELQKEVNRLRLVLRTVSTGISQCGRASHEDGDFEKSKRFFELAHTIDQSIYPQQRIIYQDEADN